MQRTYVVTGVASGIGAATAAWLGERGGRVIGCDLRDADVAADLASQQGRAALVEGVARASGGAIDAVIAVAGGGPPDPSCLSLNFFGAVATLEGLRPLLVASPAPRAVAVSSLASAVAADDALVRACLELNEPAALAAASEAIAAGKAQLLYGSAKQALNRWCRKAAPAPAWAGAGIPLNVVAPGVVDTPGAAPILSDPARRQAVAQMLPMPLGGFPGKAAQVAALLAWCASEENSLMTGQILFIDGGADCLTRGERAW
jgi:NAD(P)-dependent dehydrogenase (short-subunit alcohol dehydrogenase family)